MMIITFPLYEPSGAGVQLSSISNLDMAQQRLNPNLASSTWNLRDNGYRRMPGPQQRKANQRVADAHHNDDGRLLAVVTQTQMVIEA